MARSVDVILKEQLGNLLFQLSILQSQYEEAVEENKKLTAQLPKEEAK